MAFTQGALYLRELKEEGIIRKKGVFKGEGESKMYELTEKGKKEYEIKEEEKVRICDHDDDEDTDEYLEEENLEEEW